MKINVQRNNIFCDLDGVLFDFDRHVKDLIGIDPSNMDDAQDAYMWTEIQKIPNFYRNMPLTEYALDLWAQINLIKKPIILTAIPRRTSCPTAEDDKLEAVWQHFGNVEFRIGPFSRDKWLHATRGDLLIDDRATNTHDWIFKGLGEAILHLPHDPSATFKTLEQITVQE